jgi:ankyrin repeat protein
VTEPLPERASLDWLRKTAKQNLRHLRLQHPEAKLADAQRELARAYGFTSWRALKAQVDRTPDPSPDEIEISAFLRAVGNGEIESVRAALTAKPVLVNAAGPHPFWGGRPQALHVAIEAGRRDLFDLLIDAGADVIGRNQDYDLWSPLMLTCSRNREDMRETLLQRGARIGPRRGNDDGGRWRGSRAVLQTGRDALPEAPNDGSPARFCPHPLRDRPAVRAWCFTGPEGPLGHRADRGDSRLGSGGRALVSHMTRAASPPRRRNMRGSVTGTSSPP